MLHCSIMKWIAESYEGDNVRELGSRPTACSAWRRRFNQTRTEQQHSWRKKT